MKLRPGIGLVLSLCLYGAARDAAGTSELLKRGAAFSAAEAESIEAHLKQSPADADARIELLAYYSSGNRGDIQAVKTARAAHIFWMISNAPTDFLFEIGTGVHRLHCSGDPLADREAFDRATRLWLEQVKGDPKNATVARHAVEAIQYCAPEAAEQLLVGAKDGAGLGRLYAGAALGMTGRSYADNDPAGSDPEMRDSPFARKSRDILQATKDKDMIVSAAIATLRDGAILWADGKLDWDYTALGNALLVKAKHIAPTNLTLFALPTQLPTRGERPPVVLRVGGKTQLMNLLQKVSPIYPAEAKRQRIQGVVEIAVLIGLDGKILAANAESGPTELIPSSLGAVRQWIYKPTLFNGKPCYVITKIDVNFQF